MAAPAVASGGDIERTGAPEPANAQGVSKNPVPCAVVWVPRQPLWRGIFWRTFVSEGILDSDASSFSFVVALDKRVALSDVHSGLNQKTS
jgi:hypothetical protein